jgi:hypothetical protein
VKNKLQTLPQNISDGSRENWGEMTQTLYVHMNKIKFKKKSICKETTQHNVFNNFLRKVPGKAFSTI